MSCATIQRAFPIAGARLTTAWHRNFRWMAAPSRPCGADRHRAFASEMRICFLCCEYPPAAHGGIGAVTQVLGRALAAAGHEVRAVGVYPTCDGLPREECDGGVQVWRIATPGGRLGWTRGRSRLFQTVSRW